MKTTKLIIISIIIIAFGMAANAFGQPGKNKRRVKPHGASNFSWGVSNAGSMSKSRRKVKPHGTSNYSFGATQTGTWRTSQRKTRGTKGKGIVLEDLLVTSRRKPRKPRKH